MPLSSVERLSRWERLGLVALLGTVVCFGGIVVLRGALLHTRRTDLGVFLRAAWAVRFGSDLYDITDDKGLRYHYPPLLAILLVPLADPPPAVASPERLAFAVKVGLWYLLSIGFLAAGIEMLARALEQTSPRVAQLTRPVGCRAWWGLRVLPLLACLPALGNTLSLGQVNILWLALLCGMAAALLRGQSGRAGLWLAGAICLKVMPVFLLLYPVWRRDLRCLAGCVLGLLLGLAVIPAAVLGPEQALTSGRKWSEVILLPAFGLGSDRSRADELLDISATHNQALMATFHKTLYLDPDTRPEQPSVAVKLAHWLVGGILTGLTLLAARRSQFKTAPLLFLGALVVNMLLLSPAGHHHYLLLLLPLCMGLMAAAWERGDTRLLGGCLKWLLPLNLIAAGLPLLPEMGVFHDLGLPMYSAILLWLAGCIALWKGRDYQGAIVLEDIPVSRAA